MLNFATNISVRFLAFLRVFTRPTAMALKQSDSFTGRNNYNDAYMRPETWSSVLWIMTYRLCQTIREPVL